MSTSTVRISPPAVASLAPLLFPLAGALLLGMASPVPASPPAFTESAEFGLASTITVAWGDHDLDGDWDLAVGNTFAEQNLLFVNDGSATFTGVNNFAKKSTFALAWGDYDNDGDPDMAVGNGELGTLNASRLHTNNGDGSFSGAPEFGERYTIAVAWADYDLDGDIDLAVGNGILGEPAPNALYRNDGGGSFTEILEFGEGQTASMTWADFDDDGDPDLAIGNGGFNHEEPNALYENNGDGSFTARVEFGDGDTSCLVWGDADGDGDLDLAVANWNGGQNRLYLNDGDGTFTGTDAFGARDPNTMAWADYDNDGDLDLAVGNGDFTTADQNYLYENDGAGNFTEWAAFGLGSTDAIAWADVDGDGDLDAAAGNEHHTTQNYLYLNGENDSDWIRFHLVGQFHANGSGWSNRDGIGARVTVYTSGHIGDPAFRLGVWEVAAHGGFAAQNAIDPHFGVPGQTTVDVRVRWPGSGGSAIVQDVTGLAVAQVHVIVEAPTTTAAPPLGRVGDSRLEARPNPMHDQTSIRYTTSRIDEDTSVEMRIFDSSGRLVRELVAESHSGSASALWDGRTKDGSTASSGVYFVKVAGKEGDRPLRIVAIR